MADYRFCRVEDEGRIRIVTINRPEVLNALHSEAHWEFDEIWNEFAADPELSHAMLLVAKDRDTRKCLVLLGAILEAPELVDRLSEVLKPAGTSSSHRDGARKRSAGANL